MTETIKLTAQNETEAAIIPEDFIDRINRTEISRRQP